MGALDGGSITSNFGSINVGSSSISNTGIFIIGSTSQYAPFGVINGGLTLNLGTTKTFDIVSTNTSASDHPIIQSYRDSSSPADADALGTIRYQGNNDADQKVTYAEVEAQADDVTDGTEDGAYKISRMVAGTSTVGFELNASGVDISTPLTVNTGPITINSNDTNADLVISNSEASSAEASPIIKLSRSHGSSGGNDGDEIGEIQFFGANDRGLSSGGPQQIQYATIYGEIVDSTAGTEDGSIKFGVANSGSIEDPIFSVFNYGIVMGTDNDLRLGQRGEIWFEGASSNTNETVLFCVDPTQENTVLLPDDSGTLSLDGENQTAYRTGEIIEVITGYADGRTLAGQATSAGAARNFALENVTAAQLLSTSYQKVTGSLVTYLPPVGTKTVEIEYGIYVGYGGDSTGVMHHKLSVGGTNVTLTHMTHRDDGALNKYVILKSILTVDGSGDVAAGNVDDWDSALAIQLEAREYGSSSEIKLHRTHYMDGSNNDVNQINVTPSVRITAIG